MADENNNALVIIGIIVVFTIIAGALTFGFSALTDGGENPGDENTTTAGDSPDEPENVNNPDNESDDNSSESDDLDDNDDQDDNDKEIRTRASLTLNAETVTGEMVERGEFILYSAQITEERERVETYSLSQGPAHVFENLTAGNRYVVVVDAATFPAENFTIEAGQTEQFTAEVGYELRGAETYVREYEVRRLGRDENGNVYSDKVFVGKATVDSEGNYYTTYVGKQRRNDPSVDWFDSLYVAEENASYRNYQQTNSEWIEVKGPIEPVSTTDKVVQNGLGNYNRTFVEEVTREGELNHRYDTEIGTIDVNPETGYVTYFDSDVEDKKGIVYSEAWFSNHDDQDLDAIPKDFEPPEE